MGLDRACHCRRLPISDCFVAPLELHSSRDEAILANLPLVKRIAASLYNLRSFDGIPFDEYVQYGAEGLIQALDRFDAMQGARFETFATHRIRGAIINGLEKATEVNQQVSTLRKIAQERIQSLLERTDANFEGDAPLDQAFTRLIDVSVGLAVAYMLEDTCLYQSDLHVQHWHDGETNLAFKQVQNKLQDAMQKLNDAEQAVLDQHYFQHQSYDWIAQSMNVTKGRVSQLHRQAITKLRTAIAVGSFDALIG